jgi:putative endonuclease
MINPQPVYVGTDLDSDEWHKELINRYNYFVYILQCSDTSYYTGVTNDIKSRLWEHESGMIKNCYTFERRPVQLKYFELYHDIKEAIAREKQLKGWSRKKKEALFRRDFEALKLHSKKKRK